MRAKNTTIWPVPRPWKADESGQDGAAASHTASAVGHRPRRLPSRRGTLVADRLMPPGKVVREPEPSAPRIADRPGTAPLAAAAGPPILGQVQHLADRVQRKQLGLGRQLLAPHQVQGTVGGFGPSSSRSPRLPLGPPYADGLQGPAHMEAHFLSVAASRALFSCAGVTASPGMIAVIAAVLTAKIGSIVGASPGRDRSKIRASTIGRN